MWYARLRNGGPLHLTTVLADGKFRLACQPKYLVKRERHMQASIGQEDFLCEYCQHMVNNTPALRRTITRL